MQGSRCRDGAAGAVLVAAAALLLSACGAQQVKLAPAPGAQPAVGLLGGAEAQASQVRVIAQGDVWPGDPDVKEHVTPLRVTIENNSDAAVRVRFSDFALVDNDGNRYPALPLYAIQGSIDEPVVLDYGGPIHDPFLDYNDFYVASAYGPVYPGIGVYPGTFAYDFGYYGGYHTYWRRTELPTPEMRARALPEGVLESQGEVTGFMYFKHADVDEPRYTLQAELVNARDGTRLGRVTIPFVNEAYAQR